MSNNSTAKQPLLNEPTMNTSNINSESSPTVTPSQIHRSDDGTETSYILQQSPPPSPSSTMNEEFEENNNNDNYEDEDDEKISLSLNEILYAFSSYHAIVKPVAITMILSALAVLIINTEDTIRQGEQEMSQFYTVWKPPADSDESTGQTLARSLANSLVIVSVICFMTFGIVLLYKFRCMKCLTGYMIFSSSMLLGVMGGTMMKVAIEKYRIPISNITFYFASYNFAIVGTISIFSQLGVPMYVTQAYLVATSVILAWQLSHFDEWTSWCLLVMLALYDLCAVLTPCGPLKALVSLMQQEGSPDMPGLLYEAELPAEISRPVNRSSSSSPPSNANYDESVRSVDDQPPSNANYTQPSSSSSTPNTTMLPLAIARIYRLPIIPATASASTTAPLLQNTDHIQTSNNYTPAQLLSKVQAVLPNSGARIDTVTNNADGKPRYVVRDRHGNIKRTLLLDNNGRVFEEVDDDDDSSTSFKEKSTIKLGLGDFIFYSVLVSKAAMYSFTTFMACMLVILAGLGMTLVLLSVYHKALPALPISIFLGVTFYLVTRLVIEPWIEDIMRVPFYL